VRVISERRLKEFVERFPRAKGALNSWATAVELSAWKNPGELKRTFGTVDFVGDKTVFDIGGNKFRLIAYVHYRRQIVYIKQVLTHTEYDKGDWKL
jgi:mRNA interferase HigB